MSNGYSFHIGLNKISLDVYPGINPLKACVNDAKFWQKFAVKKNFKSEILLDEIATSKNVINHLTKLKDTALSGDLVLITFSGHGGTILNKKRAGSDTEVFDQTWCLFDRQLLDDELFAIFKKFKKAVRILVISDSCHSGTITRGAENEIDLDRIWRQNARQTDATYPLRSLDDQVNLKNQAKLKSEYAQIQDQFKSTKKFGGVNASVKLMAACADDEWTGDGTKLGVFTSMLKNIIEASDSKNYSAKEIMALASKRLEFSNPNLFDYGCVLKSFEDNSPFVIDTGVPLEKDILGFRPIELSLKSQTLTVQSQIDRFIAPNIDARLEIVINKNEPFVLSVIQKDHVVSDKIKGDFRHIQIHLIGVSNAFAWKESYRLQSELSKLNIKATVTPLISVNAGASQAVTREADHNNVNYIPEWPPASSNPKINIGWHLDEEHSQLTTALQHVQTIHPSAHVRIAHFDTGYMPHDALPPKLRVDMAKSFVEEDGNANQAIDRPGSGGQEGHGLGTIVLLAGGAVMENDIFGEFSGLIGGAPIAEVIPMRISDSVVILNADHFVEAVDYAIDRNCEVISMSMAGKPSRKMAAAVNKAYEAGIVMVSAAGNCWYKGKGAILPKKVIYPAAFERVIAATGVMYSDQPYDEQFLLGTRNLGTKFMQGSYGPSSRMRFAMAAYTPNTPWAVKDPSHQFVRSGGGTSSATPQIAAAAALYIALHRSTMEAMGYYKNGEKWKKVEAVRKALFTSADKKHSIPEWFKFFGHGTLKAKDALLFPVVNVHKNDKAPEAKSTLFGLGELISSFGHRAKIDSTDSFVPNDQILGEELMHLMFEDELFYDDLDRLDLTNKQELEDLFKSKAFKKKVKQSIYASDQLKKIITD